MTQFKMFLVAALAATAVPSFAKADYDYHELTCAAERLHESLLAFEQVAYSRHLSRYDQHRIHQATESACELVEALKCGTSWGRIAAKVRCLSNSLQRLDVRLRRHCSLLHDRRLKCAWDRVLAAEEKLTCLLETPHRHAPELQTRYVPQSPHYAFPRGPHRNPHDARPSPHFRQGPQFRSGPPARRVQPVRPGHWSGSAFDRYAELRRVFGF